MEDKKVSDASYETYLGERKILLERESANNRGDARLTTLLYVGSLLVALCFLPKMALAISCYLFVWSIISYHISYRFANKAINEQIKLNEGYYLRGEECPDYQMKPIKWVNLFEYISYVSYLVGLVIVINRLGGLKA